MESDEWNTYAAAAVYDRRPDVFTTTKDNAYPMPHVRLKAFLSTMRRVTLSMTPVILYNPALARFVEIFHSSDRTLQHESFQSFPELLRGRNAVPALVREQFRNFRERAQQRLRALATDHPVVHAVHV